MKRCKTWHKAPWTTPPKQLPVQRGFGQPFARTARRRVGLNRMRTRVRTIQTRVQTRVHGITTSRMPTPSTPMKRRWKRLETLATLATLAAAGHCRSRHRVGPQSEAVGYVVVQVVVTAKGSVSCEGRGNSGNADWFRLASHM